MAGVYIPPHFRKLPVRARVSLSVGNDAKTATAREPEPTSAVAVDGGGGGGLYSLREIHTHFWPIHKSGPTSYNCKTLHDAAAAPGVLGYMILTYGTSPRWRNDRIVFVKSNLDLLLNPAEVEIEGATEHDGQVQALVTSSSAPEPVPAPSMDDIAGTTTTTITTTSAISYTNISEEDNETQAHSANEHEAEPQSQMTNRSATPIAVFLQTSPFPPSTSALNDRSFAFEGWFHISSLAILQPRSADLMRMLDQKFFVPAGPDEVRDALRSRDDWQTGFNKRWAVIKLEQVKEAGHEAPKIARMAVQDVVGEVGVSYARPLLMTVNEMLTRERRVNWTAERIEHNERPLRRLEREEQMCRSRKVQTWRHEA
ncbi:hypothetical protein EDD37DRAFT_305054 [Exophiala viscosa]|uniref:Uncharacterized protein n=1 Tax=Exophiala viscosa TaxID=2486360 RepID=A0AAN6DYZ1_9EURO|nr:hypothetical protein EDD36DRAFT_178487 [Exophiala viscosa]KAI1619231.1 hypothetical protein EDD37DRAFT_305054 [Exophiala viscosa]